jgi:prepilin-type processing-associated H-X9-DG protein
MMLLTLRPAGQRFIASPPQARGGRCPAGVTMVELLIAIGVIALLMGIVLPSLAVMRRSSQQLVCASNLRQLGIAHTMYMNVNRESFVTVGLPHGGTGDVRASWLTTLARAHHDAYDALRSPGDGSPYWSAEEPAAPGSWHGLTLNQALHHLQQNPGATLDNDQISRWSSYAINIMLTDQFAGYPDPETGRLRKWTRLNAVPRPDATVHFLMLTEGWRHPQSDAAFARSDHVDSDGWIGVPPSAVGQMPRIVVRQMEIGAHGGPRASWTSVANYGFLDGHVAAREFREVYESPQRNRFLPIALP